MNKEELENAFNETIDNAVKLLKENVELKKRIDRAIEYIEGQNKFISGCDVYRITNWEYVLNILKGDDKE